ncbi:MAG TPA: hypothetical protein VMC85_14315 [Desulfomonilaceae bacterium]|nr:hypothetical protein [Desulfomonilaceae bacterium]
MDTDSKSRKITSAVGAAMMLSWFLIPGPLGLIGLLLMAYAMESGNVPLGVISGVLLISPLPLVLIWAPLAWAPVVKRKLAERQPLEGGTDWWSVHTRSRILYKAFFS